MRSIDFSNLNLKPDIDEKTFYSNYLNSLTPTKIETSSDFQAPSKNYEIIYCNVLGGKYLLLKSNLLACESEFEKELFYDYSIAYKVYNLLEEIEEGVQLEQESISGLYEYERERIEKEIEKLKQLDEMNYNNSKSQYELIVNSSFYDEYLELKDEVKKLRNENAELKNKLETQISVPKKGNGIISKILNLFK